MVVIQGPRFSTKSESKWFSDAGWEVINMTQYPEAWLCREPGSRRQHQPHHRLRRRLHEGTEAVNATDVLEVFQENAERIQKVVLDLIGRFPKTSTRWGRGRRSARPVATGTRSPTEDIRLFETGLGA